MGNSRSAWDAPHRGGETRLTLERCDCLSDRVCADTHSQSGFAVLARAIATMAGGSRCPSRRPSHTSHAGGRSSSPLRGHESERSGERGRGRLRATLRRGCAGIISPERSARRGVSCWTLERNATQHMPEVCYTGSKCSVLRKALRRHRTHTTSPHAPRASAALREGHWSLVITARTSLRPDSAPAAMRLGSPSPRAALRLCEDGRINSLCARRARSGARRDQEQWLLVPAPTLAKCGSEACDCVELSPKLSQPCRNKAAEMR